jgi:hypothetical protein
MNQPASALLAGFFVMVFTEAGFTDTSRVYNPKAA